MVINIFKMYFAHFLFFSILLYNIEGKAFYDYAEFYSKDDDNTTTVVASEYTQIQTTTMKPTDKKDTVDSAGWLTIENGILTAHFPETVTTTELPDYGDALNVTTNITDAIPWYSRHTTPAESNSTATTTWDSDNTTTTARPVDYAIPHYKTTTAPSWYLPWSNRITTPSEYRPWYLRTTTQRYHSWLPRTRRPYPNHYPWLPPWRTTTESWDITTTIKPRDSNWYYNNTTWSSSGTNSTTEFDYDSSSISNRNETNQTTGETNPGGSCKSCNPLNISINSKINQGADDETGNYGTFVSFLKKIVGKIIPSAINIAPNSNATNVAVASGNGNMFFYVYN